MTAITTETGVPVRTGVLPDAPLPGRFGGRVRCGEVGYELLGEEGLPVVVVLGGISASAHLTAHDRDRRPGWWEPVVGVGRGLDPRRYRILGLDHAEVAGGSVDTADQAAVIRVALEALDLGPAHAVVGASYGGMSALAFAARHADLLDRLVVLAAAHRSHPMATALRVIQRRVLRLSAESGWGPAGVALARCLGLATYRSVEEFAARFDGPVTWRDGQPRFPVEEYLDHHAGRFAGRFTAQRYQALSESLDLHDVPPEAVTTPTTLIGCASDSVVPVTQVRELAARLGGPVRLHLLHAPTGHDAFLTEAAAIGPLLARALDSEVPDAAHA